MWASSTLWLAFQPNQQIVSAWNSTHNTGTICVAWGRIRAGIPNCFQKGRGIPKMFRQFKAEGGVGRILQKQKCRVYKNGVDTEPKRIQVWLHTTTEMPQKLNIPIYVAITQHKCVNWEQQTKKKKKKSSPYHRTGSQLDGQYWYPVPTEFLRNTPVTEHNTPDLHLKRERIHKPTLPFVQSEPQRSRSEIRGINNQPYSIIGLTSGHVFEAGRSALLR